MTIEMVASDLNELIEENFGYVTDIAPLVESGSLNILVNPETTEEQDELIAGVEEDCLTGKGWQATTETLGTLEALLSSLAAQGLIESGEYTISE